MASFWSRPCWQVIHLFAFFSDQRQRTNPNQQEERDFDDFLKGIYAELPCPTCKQHMKEFLETHPYKSYRPDPKYSHMKAFCYANEFHNFVNSSQQKPTLSLEKSLAEVMGWIRRQNPQEEHLIQTSWQMVGVVGVLVAVVIIMSILLVRNRRRRG